MNTFRNDNQFLKNLPNSSSNQKRYNQVCTKSISPNIIGTYKITPYNLGFPVSDDNFSIGPSPIESSIIIDKQEERLLWGSVYFKPISKPNWIKATFTGIIDYKGIINLTIDSKTSPNNDHAIYTLTPYKNNTYQVVFKVLGNGISFISLVKKLSDKTVVPI